MAGTTWDKEVITVSSTAGTTTIGDTLAVTGLITATAGIKLGNNIIYASDGGAALTVDVSDNLVLGSTSGNLTLGSGGLIKSSGGTSAIALSGANVATQGTLSCAGDLTVTGADIVLGADADGTDRSIMFRHGTAKTIMGIHDTHDRFIINADNSGAFDGTVANNDFSIDTSGNCYIKGDLTVTGSDINFANGGRITEADGSITMQDIGGGAFRLSLNTISTGEDAIISLQEAGTTKWNIGNDGSASDALKITNNSSGSLDSDLELQLDAGGNLQVSGHMTAAGSIFIDKLDTGGDLGLYLKQGGTTKYVIGIDDSDSNKFKIHSDVQLSDNSDFEIDSSGNVEIGGDLTVVGGAITFGNGEMVNNESDNVLYLRAQNLFLDSNTGTYGNATIGSMAQANNDSKFALYDGGAIRWSMGQDQSDSAKLKFDYANAAVGGATKLTLDGSGNMTVAGGVQTAAVARTATADGTGTGLIADGTSFVTVTTADANHWITLPTPTPGNIVWLGCEAESQAFELRTNAPATVKINGTAGSNYESQIASTISLVRCVCVNSTNWICTQFDADGDETKVPIPDA
tara:strand:+ start:347 stop:2071 length:1725 start_codon:yes stop_codon:yes gene_type:complete